MSSGRIVATTSSITTSAVAAPTVKAASPAAHVAPILAPPEILIRLGGLLNPIISIVNCRSDYWLDMMRDPATWHQSDRKKMSRFIPISRQHVAAWILDPAIFSNTKFRQMAMTLMQSLQMTELALTDSIKLVELIEAKRDKKQQSDHVLAKLELEDTQQQLKKLDIVIEKCIEEVLAHSDSINEHFCWLTCLYNRTVHQVELDRPAHEAEIKRDFADDPVERAKNLAEWALIVQKNLYKYSQPQHIQKIHEVWNAGWDRCCKGERVKEIYL